MNNLNNLDIRAGLVAEIRVNCNAIEQMYIEGSEKEGELEWFGDDNIKESFWKEFNNYISPEDLMDEQELMYKFQEHLEGWKKWVIYKEYVEDTEEEEAYCECDFPKFIINDGIQSCSRCGKDDHYKCGVVADHSEDDTEEEEDADGYCGCYCDNCKSYRIKGKWVGCQKCDTECCLCCEIKHMEKEESVSPVGDGDGITSGRGGFPLTYGKRGK